MFCKVAMSSSLHDDGGFGDDPTFSIHLVVYSANIRFSASLELGLQDPFQECTSHKWYIMKYTTVCLSVAAFAPTSFAFTGLHGAWLSGSTRTFPLSLEATGVVAPDGVTSIAESAEFPPPLTSLEKLQRAATFWSVALPIVANYYGLIGNLKLQELLGSTIPEEDIEVIDFTEITVSEQKIIVEEICF